MNTQLTLPTLLTLLRILLIPLVIFLFYIDYPLTASLTFGLAGVTDWADGYLARRLQQESRLGAFLDPVADKLMVVVVLLLIIERESAILITAAGIIIIGREIIVSSLREWMAEVGQRGKVAVAYIGKLKTTAQMIALGFLLYNKDLWGVIPIREIGLLFLLIATVLTFISMVQYLQSAFKT